MEITWYGLSCFKLTERGNADVVTDPYDSQETGCPPLKLKADIVTVSHNSPWRNCLDVVKGTPYVITGPGEYEVGGVFITGIHIGSAKGQDSPHSTLYVFDFQTLTVAHLGALNRVPTQSEIELIGTVNVALLPIGGSGSLNASRAAEVISMLEPNIVIPMDYSTPGCAVPLEPLSKFLKEMGITDVEKQNILKISPNSLPEETKVMVLEDQRE